MGKREEAAIPVRTSRRVGLSGTIWGSLSSGRNGTGLHYSNGMPALALLVLNHVTVIDVVRGVPEPNRAVEIEGGHIRAVLPTANYRAPEGCEIRELTGRYLLPGFVEMHAHVLFPPLDEDGRPFPVFDRETSLALLRTLVFNGITTVRDPGDATEAAVAVLARPGRDRRPASANGRGS